MRHKGKIVLVAVSLLPVALIGEETLVDNHTGVDTGITEPVATRDNLPSASIKREHARLVASRAANRPAVVPVTKPKPKPVAHVNTTHRTAIVPQHFGNAYLVAMASCIRHHESGVYTRNSGNRYYGAYQINDYMWHHQTGLPGHASDYSKQVQDYWFMKIWSKLKTDAVRQQQWVTYKYCSYIRP